jgi:dienelactone hydrolase
MKPSIHTNRRCILRGALLSTLLMTAAVVSTQAQTITNVQVPQGNLSLAGRLFTPAGPGPFPAVVVMHGSGGMWSDDDPANGMLTHLQEWGQLLRDNGYVALFVDSFNARGIPANFQKKRPCFDSNWDDSKCSPAYERPKDAYAALNWLRAQHTAGNLNLRTNRIGLIGFSHGGETALASTVSSTVSRTWKVSYVTSWKKDTDGKVILQDGVPVPDTTNHNYGVPSPQKPASGTTGFAAVVAFYPGCGFYGYFGSTTQTATADCYLPSVPTLVLHGTADSLWQSGQPALLSAKAAAEATQHNITNHLSRIEYTGAGHSFDMSTIAPQSDWDTDRESDNQHAKRMGRTDALTHLNAILNAP